MIAMISSKLDNNPNTNGFIFDGFPRTSAQATTLDNLLSEKGTSISAMLSLKVEDEELIRRLLSRGKGRQAHQLAITHDYFFGKGVTNAR